MGFLDNSGDIILDAVLTDTGRMRLARGDGSFKIAKFALGDDEIDYSRYNKNHPSGSAYYDLEILQTPVLEAFTDNAASLRSKLLTITRSNILYMPVMKINGQNPSVGGSALNTALYNGGTSTGIYIVGCDQDTVEQFQDAAGGSKTQGVIQGFGSTNGGTPLTTMIRVDQGLDTNDISPTFALDADLVETRYIVEIDNRVGRIVTQNGSPANVSFIDDDNIASYYFTQGTHPDYVGFIAGTSATDNTQVINGPRGTFLKFKIAASLDLQGSYFLFEQLGSTEATTTTFGFAPSTGKFHYLDTNVRITGATTGYRVDIPVRFVRHE